MKRLLIILMLTASIFCGFRAKAEPVTMVVLAPLALEAAKQASPYAIRSLHAGGAQLLEIGKDFGNLLMLPLGVMQATIGAPFGFFGNGISNIITGVAAPFQLVGDVIILPWCFISGAGF